MGKKDNNNNKQALHELEAEDRKFRESKNVPKRRTPYKRDKKRVDYDRNEQSYE